MSDVIDSYEAAQAHRDEANKPKVGHETAEAEQENETASEKRPARKHTAEKR